MTAAMPYVQERSGIPSSLSDLKEIGCKSVWPVHVSPISWAIERLLPGEIVKTCPRPAEFSLRFFKSDRLLVIGGNHRVTVDYS